LAFSEEEEERDERSRKRARKRARRTTEDELKIIVSGLCL
jgi:hypothetical protein